MSDPTKIITANRLSLTADLTSHTSCVVLLANQASEVAFVLTNAFHQFHVGKEFKRDGYFPSSRICLRIVDCDLHIQVTEVAAMKPLDGVVGVCVWVSTVINPCLIVKALCVDNERIAFPAAHGISQPGRLHFFWVITAISENLPVSTLVFKKNQHDARCLDQLERSCGNEHRVRDAVGQAASGGP